jgi:hypothetical protein
MMVAFGTGGGGVGAPSGTTAAGVTAATCSGGGVGAPPWTTTGARAAGGRTGGNRPSSGGACANIEFGTFSETPLNWIAIDNRDPNYGIF